MTIRLLGYSLTGNTRAVAESVSHVLGAEHYRISAPGPDKPGLWSIFKLGFSAVFRRPARIEVPDVDWASSDVLILYSPVWAGRVSTPMRQWLGTRPALPKRVALIVTSGDPKRPDQMIEDFAEMTGRLPVATLHVSEAAAKSGHFQDDVTMFCVALDVHSHAHDQTAGWSEPRPAAPAAR